jgi:hypothetical protein
VDGTGEWAGRIDMRGASDVIGLHLEWGEGMDWGSTGRDENAIVVAGHRGRRSSSQQLYVDMGPSILVIEWDGSSTGRDVTDGVLAFAAMTVERLPPAVRVPWDTG